LHTALGDPHPARAVHWLDPPGLFGLAVNAKTDCFAKQMCGGVAKEGNESLASLAPALEQILRVRPSEGGDYLSVRAAGGTKARMICLEHCHPNAAFRALKCCR
jgi:hypothetical protein